MSTPDTLAAVVEQRDTEPPTSAYISYDDFLDMDRNEGGLVEWVDGKVIYHAMPLLVHQQLVLFLAFIMHGFVRLFNRGEVYVAPYIMRIHPGGSGREPDVLFVASENLSRITQREVIGPADLVIEIISDESVTRDRTIKFAEYEAGGVREYWVIDPRPGKQRADFYVLDAQGHYQPGVVSEDGIYHSTVLVGFWLHTAWLWQPDPNPLAALTAIVGKEKLVELL